MCSRRATTRELYESKKSARATTAQHVAAVAQRFHMFRIRREINSKRGSTRLARKLIGSLANLLSALQMQQSLKVPRQFLAAPATKRRTGVVNVGPAPHWPLTAPRASLSKRLRAIEQPTTQ